jgi:molecular chaperone GrpE
MMGEEKQVENVQDLTGDTSEVLDAGVDAEISESDLNAALDAAAGVETTSANATQNAAFDESGSQATIDQLTQEIETLKAQLEDRTGQYMRIAADFDNFRKRNQKEKEDLEQQIKCSTISELLPVVDNFERARSQLKPQTDGEMNIHKSYQSVYKQLVDCLKRVGVSPMRSEGKEFDPMLHEAVMRESTDEYSEGTVIEELVRGYLLGERVLRHAMVKVAAAPDPVITSEESDQSLENG